MSIAGRMFAINRNVSRGGSNSYYPPGLVLDRDPVGLPAVALALNLISETLGSFTARVYEGDASMRQPVYDAWQAPVLQDGAAGYCTSVDTWSQVSTSVEICGHGLIYKGRRKNGKPGELYPFPTQTVVIYVDDNGKKIIEARVGAEIIDITKDVIHVQGWSPIVSVAGSSTTLRHSRTLSGQLALEQFRGRYFDNDSTPNLVLVHPGSPTLEQRTELRDSWKSRHSGPNGEKMGLLWGGIDVKQLTSTLAEAQVAELMNMGAQDVARMFRIFPQWLMLADPALRVPDAEPVSDLFHRFTLLSRERRIERAVSADRELFPNPKQYMCFDSAGFTRGNVQVTALKQHALKQVGIITANEARAELGYPPSDDEHADELLETPVGAGANRQPAGQTNPAGGTDE